MSEPTQEQLREAFNSELELVMVGHGPKIVAAGLGDAMIGIICVHTPDLEAANEFLDKLFVDMRRNLQLAWDYYQSPESRRGINQIGSA